MTESEILEGLTRDELVFYYQPKVSLLTGKVVGAEALLRWVRPDGTVVPPLDFIPLAEETGLITRISQHMFAKLVHDMVLLMDVQPLTVSFNASARDFESDAFARQVLTLLEQAQIPPKYLQIELTETIVLRKEPAIKRNVMLLRNAGIDLAMDDFGKGYSSIDTLSQWPFTSIKLDHGLIERMLASEKSKTIVDSTIRMAHELGIHVVAEGVESDAQYQHLLAAGCTKVQGYWLGRAQPLHTFIHFVEQDIRWSGLPVGLIHLATIDHMQWRKQLISEVVKTALLPPESVMRRLLKVPPLSHLQCRLGVWYHGEGTIFANREPFLALDGPHRRFHEIGQRLIDMVAQGADIEQLTPHMRELSDASLEVMRHLQTLESEGLRDMHEAHTEWLTHALRDRPEA